MKNTNKKCEKLWREYEQQIRKICNIKLRSCPDEVDDVVSEVFLSLCEKAKSDGLPDNPKAWLYGTMNNIINMKYREIYKAKERQESLSDETFELPLECDGIEEKIEEIYNEEIKDKLKNFLSEDEFELVQYIYFDKLKMKEIAKLKGSTQAAIKQKHYRICNKLRKAAKKYEQKY